MQNLDLRKWNPCYQKSFFLNSNSIRNMFEALKFIINHNIDIFLILETKLDDLFATAQFLIKCFSASYRFDMNSKGGGLPLYIREDIPSKILTYSSNCDIETLLVKISLRKRKWCLNGFCDLNKSQVVIILNVWTIF